MYYDILAQLKNATLARKEKITMPFSKMDFAVLKALEAAGFVKSIEKEAVGRRQMIGVRLGRKKGTAIDFKIMSKPSRHTYVDYRSIRLVKQGHGLAMLSTPKGIMSGRDARKAKVGGEYLFEIW